MKGTLLSQNVLKFYQHLTGEERRVPFIFGRNNRECFGYGIGWTDVGSGGYILVSCACSASGPPPCVTWYCNVSIFCTLDK
jgi:hypothetical protein